MCDIIWVMTFSLTRLLCRIFGHECFSLPIRINRNGEYTSNFLLFFWTIGFFFKMFLWFPSESITRYDKFCLKQVVNALPLKENLNRHFQMFSRSNSNARYVDFCIQEKIPSKITLEASTIPDIQLQIWTVWSKLYLQAMEQFPLLWMVEKIKKKII